MTQNKQKYDMPQLNNNDDLLKLLLKIACTLATASLLIAVFLLGRFSQETEKRDPVRIEAQSEAQTTPSEGPEAAESAELVSLPADASVQSPNDAGEGLERERLSSIFSADSYWKMTMLSHDGEVVGESYLKLTVDCRYAFILNAQANDLRFDKFTWEYDDENTILTIKMLNDGYCNDEFHFTDGRFFTGGAYYNTELTCPKGIDRVYNSTLAAFQTNYGGFNPAKRLVTSNSHFGYTDISWRESHYEVFRNLVNNKSFGLLVHPDEKQSADVRQEINALLGANQPGRVNVDRMLFSVYLPIDEPIGLASASEAEAIEMIYANYEHWAAEAGYLDCHLTSADIINLVYPDYERAESAINALRLTGENLLSSPKTDMNMSATDIYEAAFFWNDVEAAAIIQIGLSVLIFRGPTSEIKGITEYLQLGESLWA